MWRACHLRNPNNELGQAWLSLAKDAKLSASWEAPQQFLSFSSSFDLICVVLFLFCYHFVCLRSVFVSLSVWCLFFRNKGGVK